MNTIGQNITNNLLNCGIPIKTIARMAGIPHSSLVQMKDKGEYKSSVIEKLANAIGITASKLISDSTEPEPDKIEQIKKEFPDFIDKIIKQ